MPSPRKVSHSARVSTLSAVLLLPIKDQKMSSCVITTIHVCLGTSHAQLNTF
jgi:hypothetical protein